MTLDMTSFDAALKEIYTHGYVENMVYKKNPFAALVPKDENFGGVHKVIPLIYGNPQGRSKSFSQAQTRSTESNSLLKDFLLTRSKDYGIATIDNETILASEGDSYAFLQARKVEIDGIIRETTRSLAKNMYRDSSAYLAQVSAEPTEAANLTITLKQVEDITNFEQGMVINIWSAKSGGTQRSRDGSDLDFEIDSVDRDAGTITATGEAYDSSGTIAADDYIFVKGDRGSGVSGLEGWVPGTAPDSTAFFGVDRSADVTRLGGIRFAGSGGPIEEVVIDAAARLGREGASPDVLFMSHKKKAELAKALGSKVEYVNVVAKTQYVQIGFQAIQIDGPAGPINCIADHNCQHELGWMLQLDTWKFCSLGPMVRPLDTDGNMMLRQASADGVEVRYGFYGNLGCGAPGWNARITW